MKKLIIALVLITCGSMLTRVYCEEEESEFTWARYEQLCYQYGTEPNYDTYIYLVENPQCILLEE